MILGIDVGGTHTDAVLLENFRIKHKVKVATEENLLVPLLKATSELFRGENPKKLQRVVLSTTLSTNAIVQQKTERVGMVLIPGPGLPPPLLPALPDAHVLPGYLNHRGIEVEAVDPLQLEDLKARFRREEIRHLGIVGKFSTRNPRQELFVLERVKDAADHISVGHRLSGHLNFPRRVSTTYLNAAVWKIYRHFVEQVLAFVRERTLDVPIYILKADGGTFEIGQSAQFPVQTILSGPAASVMGILHATGGREDAVALDIGGTTTDIAIFADGVPLLEAFGVAIEGHKTLIRGLRTKSIGVGGDSAVRYAEGRLQIGPVREGPAAALGGRCATPTDAMIVLNLASLGNRGKAEAALQSLADDMRTTRLQAAQADYDETCRKIAVSVRDEVAAINNKPVYTIHEILEGKKLDPRKLFVAGGPAPAIANALGQLLGCTAVVPDNAEVANAIGAALARTTAELTVHADTERGTLSIVEEGILIDIPSTFSRNDAVRIGRERLRDKALRMGAAEADLEIEVIEDQTFNMVREFCTTGKNIRVKLQIKPGFLNGRKEGT
ncbi:MAG: hydantoinase/oxoprolinase family protein [Syntrophales bacterium]|jgi:N-methylhydantoinase A/oxoprolinase/acetone carboxylase beta subunit|nr:hydantoinase/oxoprolinase family protein [Syntrophales bacterium]